MFYALSFYTPYTVRCFTCGDLEGSTLTPEGEAERHWFGVGLVIAYTINVER